MVDERTKYAYVYRHDGGDYIGCRAQGGNWDCFEIDISEVMCHACEFAYNYEWKEKHIV